jgi:hypothetical protein
MAVTHIQDRTAEGLDSKLSPLKSLKPETIEKRKQLAKYNKTSPKYSPGLSNLHFTGQLLKALKVATNSVGVIIQLSGSHAPYKSKNGRVGRDVENSEIAKYQEAQGRKFMGVDKELRQKIREMVARHVKQVLRRIKTK